MGAHVTGAFAAPLNLAHVPPSAAFLAARLAAPAFASRQANASSGGGKSRFAFCCAALRPALRAALRKQQSIPQRTRRGDTRIGAAALAARYSPCYPPCR